MDYGKIFETAVGGNVDRELITQGWILLIRQASGSEPIVIRQKGRNIIQWKPGQAAKVESYISGLLSQKVISRKDPADDKQKIFDFSEVKVDLKPVLVPLIIKKLGPIILIYTAAIWLTARYVHGRR